MNFSLIKILIPSWLMMAALGMTIPQGCVKSCRGQYVRLRAQTFFPAAEELQALNR